MKKLLVALLFPAFSFANGVDFNLKDASIPESLEMIYSDIFKSAYMLSPDVVSDTRKLTFHITPDLDARSFLIDYMNNIGISVTKKKGVDYYYKPEKVEYKAPKYSFVYKPKYRSVNYLSGVLSSLVEGDFSSTKNNDVKADTLVFYGTKNDISRIRDALPAIDTFSDEVFVGGYVYEVQHSAQYGSGLQLAASLLSSKLNVQVGGNGSNANYDNFLRISTGSLSALVQLFNTDSRFTVVSSPSLRAVSGYPAEFSVGNEVPVLGNVTLSGDQSVQSVNYRSSGVIFNVTPSVKQEVIDLEISQELSNFTKTDTGVDNSPTLTKRAIKTTVSVQDGDIIMIGGLAEDKNTDNKTSLSFLPFVSSKGKDNSKTDIVLVLQAKKVRR